MSDYTPSLIFLHHFGGSARTWATVTGLLGKHAQCFVPNLRGFGGFVLPDGSYRLEDYALDVASLVRQFGLKRYVLVGHSLGGKIALAFAADQRAGLCGLLLVAPSPPTPEPMKEEERRRLLTSHGNRAAAQETNSKITVKPLAAPVLEELIEDNIRTAPAAWQAWLERESKRDISAQLSITVPVRVVLGARDPVISVDLLEQEVTGRIPGATLSVLPDTGHLLPLEAPAMLADWIARNLDLLTPGSG